jgi:hypothetical protein
LLTITSLRLRRNRRGVSNIIVVVLSLVIIVAIISNIILWNYEMNQMDWEKMKENTGITNVERVNSSSWYTAQSEYTLNTGNRINGTYTDTQTVNNQYERFTEASTTSSYNPSGYTVGGSTTWISGSVSDLTSNNGVYTVFRSYASATSGQTLYAHQETTTINGTNYRLQRLASADTTGTSVSASMATTGRQTVGKYVYQLTGVSSIPASTWTVYYRGWQDATPSIAYDAQSSTIQTTVASSISWNHTTGTGSNRLLLVAVGVHVATGTPTTVSNVTYGGARLTQVTTAYYNSSTPRVRTYIFRLVNPASGKNTIKVTFAAATLSVAGAVTYSGVDQTTPIQTSNTATSYGTAPSVSVTVTGSGRWIFGHLGGHRTASPTAWTITEGTGQTECWAQTGQLYKGVGSNKTVSAGLQSMFWNLSRAASYVASAVVINPAIPPPIGYFDVDILIRRSDGTIRTTMATKVANSGGLTTTPTTLSGNYNFTGYTVVDQTDYLEIDYYVEVTTALSGISAYLRIDDNNLAIAAQTRATNIMLPSAYTVGVEFTGTSNIATWTQLVWTVDSCWTTANVNVTLQLYNYTSGSYPTSGNGYLSYISSATSNTDETKSQPITTNSIQFRDGSSNWKIKVTGVKTTTTQFDFKADWIEFKTNYYVLDITGTFTLDISTYPLVYVQTIEIQLRYRANDTGEKWYLKAYNWSSSTYSYSGFNSTAGHTPTTGWDYYAVNLTNKWRSYVQNNGTIHVEFVDKSPDSTQTTVDIDFLGVRAEIDGTCFTFKNEGALTSHLVSLWIINSTNHQRYDINIFMNSADTTTYLRVDISLPKGQYTIKVVTERGNEAVYSGS